MGQSLIGSSHVTWPAATTNHRPLSLSLWKQHPPTNHLASSRETCAERDSDIVDLLFPLIMFISVYFYFIFFFLVVELYSCFFCSFFSLKNPAIWLIAGENVPLVLRQCIEKEKRIKTDKVIVLTLKNGLNKPFIFFLRTWILLRRGVLLSLLSSLSLLLFKKCL